MRAKFPTLVVHLLGLAAVCAIVAYWAIRIATPPPSAAPPPLVAPPPRTVDPIPTARMFGLVQTAAAAQASNVQVVGVYAAGKKSAAVLVVDGKPPRTYVLGAQVAPGSRLVEVRADGVTVESNGVRQQAQVPPRAVAVNPEAPPLPGFTREGNTLSAPTVATAGQRAPATVMSPPLPVAPPPPGVPSPPAVPVVVPPPPSAPPSTTPAPPIQPGSVTEAPTEQTDEETTPTRRPRRQLLAPPT